MSAFGNTEKILNLKNGNSVTYFDINQLEADGLGNVSNFPFSMKVILESLLRMQPHAAYEESHVKALASRQAGGQVREEFPYMPSRVLLQDFTGVPCVVDLAALRSALKQAGKDPAAIEPQIPVDLVIDHSVQIDEYGGRQSFDFNLAKEFERNRERYLFLRWGQSAFEKLSILPPGLGICHQVNMEYLAKCVATIERDGKTIALPDTLVGTDSHTTMINSMGIVGWGVGGIEAEAAMLGQPIPILTPIVTGMKLTGKIPEGVTPTDVALTVTQILREKGVVGQFVEFFGAGLSNLSLADRAPIANMAPEYGATMGFFPIDQATLEYLHVTGKSDDQIDLVERYCKELGIFRTDDTPEPAFDSVVELDMSTVRSSVAGPKRPQDKVFVNMLHEDFKKSLITSPDEQGFGLSEKDLNNAGEAGERGTLSHGSIVIASITSCTNTSNPSLLIGAGLIAKKAVEKGLQVPAFVKTSLAPGSRVVTEYLKKTDLLQYLEKLGFHVVAYGCTTCIGNSGPLKPEVEQAIKENDLIAAAVLSGNRNFEGRIHPLTQANYLASPPLVVAYALKGTVAGDFYNEPLGTDKDGNPVYLKDLWPTQKEINNLLTSAADPELYKAQYSNVKESSPAWNKLGTEASAVYGWEDVSTYIREPSFFENFPENPPALKDINDAQVLGLFGDFITTDHISPAGAIPKDSPASRYLQNNGVKIPDFNSFGSRRGNHEVMMRGTFANIRIRNKLVEKTGGYTVYHPDGSEQFIYDAAMKYKETDTPLVIVAGKLYGAGSSRDWAAKGTYLLGVQAVIAESFERIHRSNLVEMGVLPLEFIDGQNADSLGLTGKEKFTITGIAQDLTPGKIITVTADDKSFETKCRIDSSIEVDYYRHGGILQYVLREVMQESGAEVSG